MNRDPAAGSPSPRAPWIVAAVLGVGLAATLASVLATRGDRGSEPAPAAANTGVAVEMAPAIDPDRPVSEPDATTPLLAEAFERGRPHGRLVTLRLEGVRADGSLDAEKGKLSATFLREVAPAEAGGSARGTICHDVEYTLAKGWTDERVTYPGFCERFRDHRLYRPRCSMKNVWALAREAAAPDGLASIDYRGDGTFFFFIYKGRDVQGFGASLPDACR